MTVLFQKEEEGQDIWQLDSGSELRYTKEAGKTSMRVANLYSYILHKAGERTRNTWSGLWEISGRHRTEIQFLTIFRHLKLERRTHFISCG
jgi:hypothetical protein